MKNLIEKLREASYSASHGEMADLLQETADAIETKTAPVGEREAFEEWFFCPSNSLLAEWEDAAWEAFQAAAAPSAPKADDPVKVQLLEALEELMYAHTDKAEALATAAIAAARQEGGKV